MLTWPPARTERCHIAGETSTSSKCVHSFFPGEICIWISHRVKMAPSSLSEHPTSYQTMTEQKKQVRTYFLWVRWDIYLLPHTESTLQSLRPFGLDIRHWTFTIFQIADWWGREEAGFHNPMNQSPLYTNANIYKIFWFISVSRNYPFLELFWFASLLLR